MRDILHISDVHLGPPHLPRLAEGLLAFAEREAPDLIVLSGDLTQRAKPRQFVAARAFVDRLPAPTLVVPGNHDVPLYRCWERFLSPHGAYGKHFDRDLEPVFRDDELLVAGVNTAHGWTFTGGRFRSRRLGELQRLFAEARGASCRIVVAHHDLIPPPRFDRQRVSRNSVAAVRVFADSGVELVLSGHRHQAYVGTAGEFYPDEQPGRRRQPVLIVHSGTTTSNRGRGVEKKQNTCNWIQVRKDAFVVSRLWWNGQTFVARSRQHHPRGGVALEAPRARVDSLGSAERPVPVGEPG